MAVRIADFSKKHIAKVRALWLCSIFATTALFVGMLLYAGQPISIAILLAMPVFVLQFLTMLLILPMSFAPLDILGRAIAQISGQRTNLTPPHLNGTRYEKNGLKDMVDVLYKLATGIGKEEEKVSTEETIKAAMIDEFPFGIVGLTVEGVIVYANKNAPVQLNEANLQTLKLLFDDEKDTLALWLEHAEQRTMGELKTWQHVQDSLPGSEGRKVYDIFAQYNGASTHGADVLLIAIDRTKHYLHSEDDMDFISLAAHELRGPMTVIHGYLDVLQDELKPHLQPDQTVLFERLSVSTSRLTGYINNILNVARYDRRHLTLSLQEDSLQNVWHHIEADISLRASTQNRLLQVNIPANLPSIAADRNSLSEVMANLIDNAIKYSHEGGIVQITAAQDGDMVKCSVKDSGIGMPAAVVSNLFTKFYRSHRTRQDFSGTGLGLYISKAIIESHGGSIGVRSTEGEGSVFTFSVPVYEAVREKLLANNNSNKDIINHGAGWIKNHAMREG